MSYLLSDNQIKEAKEIIEITDFILEGNDKDEDRVKLESKIKYGSEIPATLLSDVYLNRFANSTMYYDSVKEMNKNLKSIVESGSIEDEKFLEKNKEITEYWECFHLTTDLWDRVAYERNKSLDVESINYEPIIGLIEEIKSKYYPELDLEGQSSKSLAKIVLFIIDKSDEMRETAESLGIFHT